MKKIHATIIIIVIIIVEMTSSQSLLILDQNLKSEIIEKVAKIMKDKYVFEEVGNKMSDFLVQQHNERKYDSITDIKEFCQKLTSDLRQISNDKHLFVFYSPEEAKEVAARNKSLSKNEIKKIEDYYELSESRSNYGFNKVEILVGNIGYIDIDYFSSSVNANNKVDNIIGFVENTDAIIIDLRDNGGGGGSGADQLLMSYFFGDERVPFSGVYYRETDRIHESWSNHDTKCKKLPNIDLYILTNSNTFSAAEFIAYSLQVLNRAVIIGEVTKGGAHPVDVLIVKGDILTQVSIGNSINPITNSNWEETGVIPEVTSPSDSALTVAYKMALKKIMDRTEDKLYKDNLNEIINNLK